MSASQKERSRQEQMVAVAIDKDKGSQIALKWAVDNLLCDKGKSKSVILLHVKLKTSSSSSGRNDGTVKVIPADSQLTKELFLPFRCFCTRKGIQVNEVVMEDADVARALCNYARQQLINQLVVGYTVKNGFVKRNRSVDIPVSVSKWAPEFCHVYFISKGKVASERPASSLVPTEAPHELSPHSVGKGQDGQIGYMSLFSAKTSSFEELDSIKSPFTTRSSASLRPYGEISMPESDISFVSSGWPSTNRSSVSLDHDFMMASRLSYSSDPENRLSSASSEANSFSRYSLSSQDGGNYSWSGSQSTRMEDMEAEMRRLKQELKQTMELYSTACKEAFTEKQKTMELQRWKSEEQKRIEEARLAEVAALPMANQEKEKCWTAIEKAEGAQRLAEQKAQKRMNAEMKALKEAEERKKVLDKLAYSDVRYRKYPIEEIEVATEYFSASLKIGEGGYGPVYKCYLDHTPVAVKVLRPDAAQGKSQFQQEVEVLSSIRHPNMVLLLGACPEYGCLIYEHMANGSLEDRLFRQGNTPPLPWQLRFRIAAEIGTALLFLHQTKPEPLVHRDLKPANILLDRNFVSKISDVGLARLVPASVADSVTQYHMTSAAGTFCYIDPEYQQTGMLGTKSDVYSLGVMLLQIITAKSPMGLTHQVQRAIDKGHFPQILDPAVPDWPVGEALKFAKLALKCVELRRKDRPDLGNVVLPELNRLRALAEKTMPNLSYNRNMMAKRATD